MLSTSAARILDRLGDDDVVLDIGGWGRPFTRADWVMDLMPYETRGLYGADGPAEERLSPDRWIQRDICDREPYPFADKELDFVICSHTLEDIRDPIFVCSEMIRIAKAGYIEVPSRLEEQSYGFQGPWVGWGHHRWLIEIEDGAIEFVFKHHVLHNRSSDHFPPGFQEALPAEARVQVLWWEDSFRCEERVFVSGEELDPYLADYIREHQADVSPQPVRSGGRRSAGIRNRLVRRLSNSPGPASERDAKPRVADVNPPNEHDEILRRAFPHTMTGYTRLKALVDAVRYCDERNLPGAFVECGVWLGGSVLAMILTLQDLGREDRDIYLYDTFDGMTPPTDSDTSPIDPPAIETWREAESRGAQPWPHFDPGVFNEDKVRALLNDTGYPEERLHFVRGPVEETIPATMPREIALLRLDTDWYESTRHELVHLFPRLGKNGVLIVDDYGHWQGCRRAVDEYFADRPPLLLHRIDYTARMAVNA